MSTGRKINLKNRKISVLFMILWMVFIFVNSAQTGEKSDKTSHFFADKIVSYVKKLSPKTSENMDKINHLVRKNAHGLEYFILALLTANVFRSFGKKPKAVFIDILFVCLLYAVSDEFHQGFVQGRASMVGDVLIDFSGSFIGTIVYYWFWAIFYK